MWITNYFSLIIGTVAAVMGISFYIRNKEAAGNIRFYILSLGITSATWCICYGIIGLFHNLALCAYIRKIGVLAICAFLVTEAFLVSEMSGISNTAKFFARLAAIISSVLDFIIYSPKGVDIYVRKTGWTTWFANPEYQINRNVHSFYIFFIFLILISCGILWIKNNKLKRLKHFLFLLFVSNFTMLFFTLPDTFLPAMGKPAVSTSGIGAALCTIVIWYGAIQLNSFDIRTGNVKDRLFDFLEAGIIVFDTEHHIVLLNHSAQKLVEHDKYREPELNDFFQINAENKKQIFLEAEKNIYSVRLPDKTGSKFYSVKISAVDDNYGDLFCYMCVFMDITEEVEAAAQLKIASQAKSRFLAQMSHEIRTPINAVLGMNEMILLESEDKEILEYAENIHSAGNTLLALINSILDFSKIEDGKMDIVPVSYDTASLINDLYHSIVQRVDSKGLSFLLEVEETLPCTLVGDDVRVSQIIMNLLTNAVKYTEKGTITLSIRESKREAKNITLFVSVKDTGIGIKEEDTERLFESFERLDKVRNHSIEGTGLGISIVTSLLEMMGSSLQVKSQYGIGSEFYFTIQQEIADATPIGNLQERMKESTKHTERKLSIHAPHAKVLLVDDNEMNLKVAKNLLKLCEIQPDMVSSGAQTIEIMKQKEYDIVLLDHMMPKMDGIETLQKLNKEHLIPKHTTMIALTANAVVGAREMYLEAGFTDYLSKPIEIKELVKKLKQYLPKNAYEGKNTTNTSEISEVPPKPSNIPDRNAFTSEIMEFPAEEENNKVFEFPTKEEDNRIFEFAAEPEDSENMMEFSQESTYSKEELEYMGIDFSIGLNYCGNDENLYFEMLEDYLASCDEKLNKLDGLFHTENWNDYEVSVHAFKSNSKTIGAMSLFEQAKSLEEAAEHGDTAYIKAHHHSLITSGRELLLFTP